MSKDPVSHHYLPQFYLKFFSFDYIKRKKIYRLYSYDKEYQPVVTPKTTKEICCEKHRNTLDTFGERDFFIEKTFSELEGIMAEFFRVTTNFCNEKQRLNNPAWLRDIHIKKSKLTPLDELKEEPYYCRVLNYFIHVFYWRLTKNDLYFELNTTKKIVSKSIDEIIERSQTLDFEDLSIIPSFLNEVKAEIELPFLFGEEENFIKIYKNLIYPIQGVFFKNQNNFKLYQANIVNQFIVGSDMPFVTDQQGIGLDKPFLFTWSPNIVYINTCIQSRLKISNVREWVFKLSVLNYLQAKRFVFSKDSSTLKNVIHYTNMRYNPHDVEIVKQELYSLMKSIP